MDKLGFFRLDPSEVPEASDLKGAADYLYRCIDVYKRIKDNQRIDYNDLVATASLMGLLASRKEHAKTGGTIRIDPKELPSVLQIDVTIARLEKSAELLTTLRMSLDPMPESLRAIIKFLSLLRGQIDETPRDTNRLGWDTGEQQRQG